MKDKTPDWLTNPLNGERFPTPQSSWWLIPDFDARVGDIKLIWELSRMDWAPSLAKQATDGDEAAFTRLNSWLQSWCDANLPYQGPNWKCGQEASLRIINVAIAAAVLESMDFDSEGLRNFLVAHLQRVAPTIQYAVSQDNNHGTSEAVGLFVGGAWVSKLGEQRGVKWMQLGRRLLQNRVARLIGDQGSFSQYSLNYHRLMLDTLSIAEYFRKKFELPTFGDTFLKKSRAATHWLYSMTDKSTGDVPNIGANDGARLLQFGNSGYRDFRPCLQLAQAIFFEEQAYSEEGDWNEPLKALRIERPKVKGKPACSFEADDGGFVTLRRNQATAILRYPRFRFRPSHADALHVDLFLKGINWLRDAGSYSYNTEKKWLDYFSGTQSHNTIQFDDRDQMPRLSRFLYGDWLQTATLESLHKSYDVESFGAGYEDSHGASHFRRLSLTNDQLRVDDIVRGFSRKAVLRWRLPNSSWKLNNEGSKRVCCWNDEGHSLQVQSSAPMVRFEFCQGYESRHYLEKSEIPVLEIETNHPGSFETVFAWSS